MIAKEKNRISGDKLKASVLQRYKSYDECAKVCGFTGSWLSNFIDKELIPNYAVILLERVCGIPFDEYAYTEPEVKQEVKQEVDANQIAYKMMFSAAYAACAEFCNKHMEPLVRAAVDRALDERRMR